jgi:2-oxoglutarate/2-oxoacid ferredoxin oxidoreductase subunit beta
MSTFELRDYQGSKSTLCTGCGHDSVTNQIIKAYFEAGVSPYRVAKISGIGCSSKTPAYFMNMAHGFNSIHGRMAAVATGAKLANADLEIIGVSGDGDTASIGLGGFLHLVRRNLPMVYIIENNGVYGLTKGQFSATADEDMRVKSGEPNMFGGLDLCALAISSGCGFVARSFSGDGKQLVTLLKAAIEHPGTAVIDVVSPCITYANHDGSTLSYDYVKEHKVSLQDMGFILETKAVEGEFAAGEVFEITLASGKVLRLHKMAHKNHDITNASSALQVLNEAHEKHEILTGLIYHGLRQKPLPTALKLPNKPLAGLGRADLSPTASQWQEILNAFR